MSALRFVCCGFNPSNVVQKTVKKKVTHCLNECKLRVRLEGLDHSMISGCNPATAYRSLREGWVKYSEHVQHPLGCNSNWDFKIFSSRLTWESHNGSKDCDLQRHHLFTSMNLHKLYMSWVTVSGPIVHVVCSGLVSGYYTMRMH